MNFFDLYSSSFLLSPAYKIKIEVGRMTSHLQIPRHLFTFTIAKNVFFGEAAERDWMRSLGQLGAIGWNSEIRNLHPECKPRPVEYQVISRFPGINASVL